MRPATSRCSKTRPDLLTIVRIRKLWRNNVFLDVSQLFRQRRRDGRNLRKCFPKRYFRFQQCAGPGSAFYLNFDRPNRVVEEDFKIEDNQIPWRRDQRGGLKGRGQGSAAGDLRTIGLLVRHSCKTLDCQTFGFRHVHQHMLRFGCRSPKRTIHVQNYSSMQTHAQPSMRPDCSEFRMGDREMLRCMRFVCF